MKITLELQEGGRVILTMADRSTFSSSSLSDALDFIAQYVMAEAIEACEEIAKSPLFLGDYSSIAASIAAQMCISPRALIDAWTEMRES